METTVETAIALVRQYIGTMPIKKQRRYLYSMLCRHLQKYSLLRGVQNYSHQLGLDYLAAFEKASLSDGYGRDKYRFIHMVTAVVEGKDIPRRYYLLQAELPEPYREYLMGYKKHLEQLERQKSGIVAMVSRVKQFLKYLIRCSIQVPDITVSVLDAFVAYLSSKYSSSAKSNILFTLRDFLSFLEDLSVVDKGSSSLVGKIITHKQEKLASWYTQEEIEQILDCIDTSSLDGKRDYAILMTASHLGMRISDICRLTLGSFDWERQTVQFIQKKTNNMEVLPIPEILILALADYIKNARPSTNHKELFVTLNAYGENTVSPGTSYLMLNKYMMLAGINTEGKHHGMHALRHSLASSLLGNDNPLPVITGILGHSSSEVTSQYLWMASDRLRPLALEVPPWIMV